MSPKFDASMRMFGRPHGILGRIGGILMARGLGPFNAWIVELLDLDGSARVLEVGFGPGVATRLLSVAVPEGHVAGVDSSAVMLSQASSRNASAISAGRVDLRPGKAEHLPFEDGLFDVALSVNSMQIWSDQLAGLHEIRRVLRPGGRVALGFTPVTGQSPSGVTRAIERAGFTRVRIAESEDGFCALAVAP